MKRNLINENLTKHDGLARRSVNSVKWNIISNLFQIFFGFLQTILLARLLPIETFGIFAGAAALTTLLGGISNFGLGGAFIYRCEETENLEQAAAVHFTLQALLSIVWAIFMLAGGILFIKSNDGYLMAYIVLTLCKVAANFAITPKLILHRSVQFKRVAIIDIISTFGAFLFAIILALLNQPLWALLIANVVGFLVDYILLYIWKPVWKPRVLWVSSMIRYFLGFGSKQVFSRLLSDALDRLDDVWTKAYLGSLAMGFYSRAYSIALYPGKIISDPIKAVSVNTYAEIAENREKLSDAFHRTNAFLIRSGFFLVGLLAVTAPEFIRVILGERWMPMLTTYRLMLPFTMFFPMKITMGNLFVAVGKPEILIKIRIAQLIIFLAGLYSLGRIWGIDGVAVAVDLMMVVGIGAILVKAKSFVNYSLRKFFLFPLAGLAMGITACLIFEHFFAGFSSDILSGLSKAMLFSIFYTGILLIFDRKEIFSVIGVVNRYILNRFQN